MRGGVSGSAMRALYAPGLSRPWRSSRLRSMRTLTRSALIARSPAQVFALVNDIARYPDFVPGCVHAEILMHNEREIVARLKVRRGWLGAPSTTPAHPPTRQRSGDSSG